MSLETTLEDWVRVRESILFWQEDWARVRESILFWHEDWARVRESILFWHEDWARVSESILFWHEDWARVRESILFWHEDWARVRESILFWDEDWTRVRESTLLSRKDWVRESTARPQIESSEMEKEKAIIEIHVLERLTWMPFSDLNLTRIASSAPGQQIGKQHPSPIRWERLIIKQHGQHQPNKPEKENTQYSLNHLGMYSQSQISYKSSRSHKPEKGSLTPLNSLAMTGSETTFRGGGGGGGECQ